MEDAEKQDKKQNYDWLKAYQFVKGQSGNPNGRPPGKSLKTFAREFLESLPDDQKVKYLKTLPTEVVWKMAEGNPETKTELHGSLNISDVLSDLEQHGPETTKQGVAAETPVQDPQQGGSVGEVHPE